MNISSKIYTDFREGHVDALYAEAFLSLKNFAERFLPAGLAMMAEDCVQDAVVKAYQTRHTFNTPLQLKAFLFTCVHNQCVSLQRKNDTHQNYLSLQTDDSEDGLLAAIIEQETLDRLSRAISELPEKYRELFDLSYRQGLRHAEVARRLGLSVDGVQKRRIKMIELLRRRFEGDEGMLLVIALLQTAAG